MDVFWLQLFAGLSIASILLLIALGLTFTFGQMGVINMAHGELIMAGAYTSYVLQKEVFGAGRAGTSFLIAIPVAFLTAGTIGVILERLIIRHLYGRPLDTLLVTWGISLMMQQGARDLFGAPNVQLSAPGWLQGSLTVGDLSFAWSRIFIMGLVIAAVLGVGFFLTRLPQGRRMRAVMQNRQLAACSGIPTARVDMLTFFIGAGLAGIAGVAIGLIGPIGPNLGTYYIVDAFLVVIVGGLGQMRGAVIAALFIGVMNAFVEYGTTTSVAKVIVFATIIVFLQFRPQGLVVLRSRALT
ncbi:MAG: urea ABC transporter permease subunit UrtB [Actinobacteria bacterium]|nr:urea ABC transporter permease subunit UrtB [Actinomycetota bacterium]